MTKGQQEVSLAQCLKDHSGPFMCADHLWSFPTKAALEAHIEAMHQGEGGALRLSTQASDRDGSLVRAGAAMDVVRELAESVPWHAQGHMDDESCLYCGAEKGYQPHADTCLWPRARKLAGLT